MNPTQTYAQERPNRGLKVRFEKRDIWIGVFWRKEPLFGFADGRPALDGFQLESWLYEVYVCILPCLPIKAWWVRDLAKPILQRDPEGPLVQPFKASHD